MQTCIITVKQKRLYEKRLKDALACLKKAVTKNPLIDDVTLDSKRESANGYEWSDVEDTDIVLTQKGILVARIHSSSNGSDGRSDDNEYTRPLQQNDYIFFKITPEKITRWIKMLK